MSRLDLHIPAQAAPWPSKLLEGNVRNGMRLIFVE